MALIRRVTTAVTISLLTVSLAACQGGPVGPDTVYGTAASTTPAAPLLATTTPRAMSTTTGATTTTSGVRGPWSNVLPQPGELGADWASLGASPADGADLFSLCGIGTGIAAMQSSSVEAFYVADGSVHAVVRIASYPKALTAAAAVHAGVRLAQDCMYDAGDGSVTSAYVSAGSAGGHTDVSSQTLDPDGAQTSAVSYWTAVNGVKTIEVWLEAGSHLSLDDVNGVAGLLLDAAVEKASGVPVNPVAVPKVGAAPTGGPVTTSSGTVVPGAPPVTPDGGPGAGEWDTTGGGAGQGYPGSPGGTSTRDAGDIAAPDGGNIVLF